MEASIMSGDDLNAGCVTLVEDILHPITLARRVMEHTNHTFLGGDGAMRFAKEQGIEILNPKGQLVTKQAKDALEAFKRDKAMGLSTVNAKTEIGGDVGTVGAVAIDKNGNIAVATSTGGMTGKIVGRIGDTPLIGCGTYADNNCGIYIESDFVCEIFFVFNIFLYLKVVCQRQAMAKLLCDTMLHKKFYKESSS